MSSRTCARSSATALLAASFIAPQPASAADDLTPPGVTLTASPRWFSPNGDGYRESTTIGLSLDEPAHIIANVRQGSLSVAEWSLDVPIGLTRLTWDGRAGEAATPDGVYRLEIMATDPSGNATTEHTSLHVDTTPPSARWMEVDPDPSDGRRRRRFRFAIRDADPYQALRWSVFARDGRRIGRAHHDVGDRSDVIGWTPTRPLFPGNYEVRMRPQDRAGNIGSRRRLRWRVHHAAPPRVIRRLDQAGRRVALTFDDCVDGTAWGRILSILKRLDAEASFFCSGARLRGLSVLARRTVRSGHTVGGHAWDHAYLPGLSDASIRTRLLRDREAWWRAGGATSAPYFRPPYGAIDARVVRIAGETGHPLVMLWDVDPQDWRRPGAGVIAQHVIRHSQPGSIVVMHTLSQTADALPDIIRGLRARNLIPSDLEAMFAASSRR